MLKLNQSLDIPGQFLSGYDHYTYEGPGKTLVVHHELLRQGFAVLEIHANMGKGGCLHEHAFQGDDFDTFLADCDGVEARTMAMLEVASELGFRFPM